MPEITATHIAVLVIALIIGMVIGWFGRDSRSSGEKAAINEGWQEQLAAQRGEQERLLEQNKSLMEQNIQHQASSKDAKIRAKELSDALKENLERRDELQRQLKDIRGNLESAVNRTGQLQSDMQSQTSKKDSAANGLHDKDKRIEKLERELENWQSRLPPLVEKFRQRNTEAEELEKELAAALERIQALEDMVGSEQTRVEPVDPDAMTDGMDASNEPIDDEPAANEAEDLIAAEELEDVTKEDKVEEPAANEAEDLITAGELEDVTKEDKVEELAVVVADKNRPRDNLKMIKGIGPAIEKSLNEVGICHFDQIAEMSEYDIDRVAHRLKGFRSRIYREDWIGQARDLHDQKVNGPL